MKRISIACVAVLCAFAFTTWVHGQQPEKASEITAKQLKSVGDRIGLFRREAFKIGGVFTYGEQVKLYHDNAVFVENGIVHKGKKAIEKHLGDGHESRAEKVFDGGWKVMDYDYEVSNATLVSPHCGIVTVAVTAKVRFKGNTTEHKSVETFTFVGHGDDLLIVMATVSPNTPNP